MAFLYIKYHFITVLKLTQNITLLPY